MQCVEGFPTLYVEQARLFPIYKAHLSMCHLCKSLHGVMRAIHIVHRDFLCPEAIIALKEEVTPRIMFSKEHS